jgi:hypothetical protein
LTAAQGRTLLASLPEAPEGLTYICIGPNVWGSAKVASSAAKRAREEGGGKGPYIIHLVNGGAEVDCVSGNLYYAKSTTGLQLGIARFKQ